MKNQEQLRDIIQNKNFVMFFASLIFMCGILASFYGFAIFYCAIFVFQKCVLSPGAGAAGQNADCPATTAICLLSRKNER